MKKECQQREFFHCPPNIFGAGAWEFVTPVCANLFFLGRYESSDMDRRLSSCRDVPGYDCDCHSGNESHGCWSGKWKKDLTAFSSLVKKKQIWENFRVFWFARRVLARFELVANIRYSRTKTKTVRVPASLSLAFEMLFPGNSASWWIW